MDKMLQLSRLKAVREVIKTERIINPATFNMSIGISDCGTIGCIAGWTVITFVPPTDPKWYNRVLALRDWCYTSEIAGNLLGINVRLTGWLFMLNSNSHYSYNIIPPELSGEVSLIPSSSNEEGLKRLDHYISLVEKYSEEELRSKGLICY
jgi:hypothetical protein